jgi:hypothetical protein
MPVVAAPDPAATAAARRVMPPRPQVKPRDEFGLRGQGDSR